MDHVASGTRHGEMVPGEVTFKYVEASGGTFTPAYPAEHWFGETLSQQYHERASRFWDRWHDTV